MQEPVVTFHGFVSGKVQGVFFRASTQEKAIRLGLNGWVKNVPDGRVELLFCGPTAACEAMRDWLLVGPRMARVDRLELDPVDVIPAAGFPITG